ncbi:MAG: tetratricopeptide repeat protein, partial [Atribacterota bacterium]|nr:tetratricopeptide repeat protein [Atribacterota bacterium]
MKIRLVFVVLIWFLSVSFAMAQNAQEYYKNGYLYFSQGNYEKALESYQKALELDPQLRDAQYWLGKVYEKLGNIPEAIAAWRQVLVVQPLHKDAFQKWRAYVRLGEVDEREKARLQEIFLYQSATPSISKEEAWSTIMPYALSLMGTRDLTSLRLAGAIMRWAGKNVSALFVPYEKPCYRKALEILREDFSREDPYLVYEFLRECLMRFEGDQEILNLVNGVLEIVFATEAQISKETGGQTAGIEFRAYQDRVEKEALGSLEGQACLLYTS